VNRHAARAGCLAALTLALVAVPLPAEARAAGASFRIPASYRSWKLDASAMRTTVSQLHLPFTTSVAMGTRADLVVSGAMGFSSVKPDSGRTLTLDGPADVTAQAFLRAAGNRLLLQAGVNLPTGKRSLGADQLAVTRALAHPLLAFRLKQYGQGTDVNAGLAIALPLAPGVTFGVGAGRIFRGAYPLGDGMSDFEPSPETAISSGLNLGGEDGTRVAARLDAVYRLYGTDRQGGLDIFEPGNQTELQLTARAGDRGLRADVTGRLVRKADDRFLSAVTEGEPLAMRAGAYSRFTAVVDAPVGGRRRAGLNAEWSGFSGSDLAGINIPGTDQIGINGSVYGGGPQLRLAWGRSGVFALGGSYLLGTLDAGDTTPQTDLTGFAVFCSLAWRTGP
jgi:hypothetical protein